MPTHMWASCVKLAAAVLHRGSGRAAAPAAVMTRSDVASWAGASSVPRHAGALWKKPLETSSREKAARGMWTMRNAFNNSKRLACTSSCGVPLGRVLEQRHTRGGRVCGKGSRHSSGRSCIERGWRGGPTLTAVDSKAIIITTSGGGAHASASVRGARQRDTVFRATANACSR